MIDLAFCEFYDTGDKDNCRFYDDFDKARLMDAIKGYHVAECIEYGEKARDMIDKLLPLVFLAGGDLDDEEYNAAHEMLTGVINDLKQEGRYAWNEAEQDFEEIPKYPRVLEVLASEYIGYSGDIKTYRRGYLHTFHGILHDFYVDMIPEDYNE